MALFLECALVCYNNIALHVLQQGISPTCSSDETARQKQVSCLSSAVLNVCYGRTKDLTKLGRSCDETRILAVSSVAAVLFVSCLVVYPPACRGRIAPR